MSNFDWLPIHDALDVAEERWSNNRPVSPEIAKEICERFLNLLRSGNLTAYYTDPIFGQVTAIQRDRFLPPEAMMLLVDGRYWPMGRPVNHWDRFPSCPIYVDRGELTRALSERTVKPSHRPPDKRQAAVDALRRLYPDGGFAAVKTEALLQEVNDSLKASGLAPVSEPTLKRAAKVAAKAS